MTKKNKLIALVVSAALICTAGISATVAYLADKSDEVVNTFTIGKVDIELTQVETSGFKMVPGNTYTATPTVTVLDGSEDSWLFIEVTDANNDADYIKYSVQNTDWELVAGETNVYVYTGNDYTAVANDSMTIFADNKVSINEDTVDMAYVNSLNGDTTKLPTITIKGYAIQKANIATIADAWAQFSK